MIPVLSQLLCDNESLLEYERSGDLSTVNLNSVCRRLIATERQYNPMKSDMYYEGLGEHYLSDYKEFSILLWKLPYDLSNEYLLKKKGHLYVKAERFDGWMNLITQIPPLLIVSAAFLDDFSSSLLSKPAALYDFVRCHLLDFKYTAQVPPYLPDLNYLVQENGGFHDLHIHLNGSTESDAIWHFMRKNVNRVVKDFIQAFHKKEVRRLSEQVIPDFSPETLLKRLDKANELRTLMIERVAYANGMLTNKETNYSLSLRNLWGEVEEYTTMGDMIEESLLFILVMKQIRKGSDELLARWFHHYLLIKGVVHRFSVMQRMQKSFPQFQMLTENSFRYAMEKRYKNRFLQLATCGNKSYLATIEGRFSPKKSKLENSRIVSSIYDGFCKACKDSVLLCKADLVLIAHFIKQPETTMSKSFPIRHRFLRKELMQKAVSLYKFMQESKYGKFIVGIDAAASEMDAGPEVFAPAFRFLRKKGIPHCTYHVGEDFRHLLSGLKSIWEAMFFLELMPGDRLGHCSAIGISPELWSKRMGSVCYIPQGEWLDDLVFVWELIKESKHLDIQYLSISVESQIQELSHKVYGKAFPAYILSEAWKLRKYDPFFYLEGDRDYIEDWNGVDDYQKQLDVFEKLETHDDLRIIMSQYHNLLEIGAYRERYDRLIEVKTVGVIPVDALVILQDIILKQMTEKGLVIEALPTSNVRICYYNEMDEYHLNRWLQQDHIDEHLQPAVVLGTDDPGIFMTNIYNEYARAYLHLERSGFSAMKKMNVLCTLQKNSNIYKFSKE